MPLSTFRFTPMFNAAPVRGFCLEEPDSQIPLLLDLRIVTDDVEFGMTELNVGSAAIMGSAFPLPLLAETICTD